jgi:hypothetical protein
LSAKKLISQEDGSNVSTTNNAARQPASTAVISELHCRLAEDDAAPSDTVAWKCIKAEAQARWAGKSIRKGINDAS